jgi:hypothetical protein
MKTSTERGLLIIISDFIGMRGEWERTLRTARAKFDVIGAMIRDPRDEVMPEEDVGQVVVQDPYSSENLLISPKKIGEEYRKFVQTEENRIETAFMKSNLDLLKLSTAEPFIRPLAEFFSKRRKWEWR